MRSPYNRSIWGNVYDPRSIQEDMDPNAAKALAESAGLWNQADNLRDAAFWGAPADSIKQKITELTADRQQGHELDFRWSKLAYDMMKARQAAMAQTFGDVWRGAENVYKTDTSADIAKDKLPQLVDQQQKQDDWKRFSAALQSQTRLATANIAANKPAQIKQPDWIQVNQRAADLRALAKKRGMDVDMPTARMAAHRELVNQQLRGWAQAQATAQGVAIPTYDQMPQPQPEGPAQVPAQSLWSRVKDWWGNSNG